MKHISLSFALIFLTLSPVFASSGVSLDADAQLARLEELKVGRAPWAAFPELMSQLQDNARMIRARVGEGLHTSFDAAHKEIEVVCGQELTLFRFNMAHYVYAHFLTAAQTGRGLETDAVATHVGYVRDTASFPELAEHEPDRPVHHMSYAARYGLYPYTFVNQTGVFSLDTLNRSFAKRAPFCGLPLELSAYDGGQNEDALSFLDHDWRHVYFNRGLSSFEISRIALAYDMGHNLYNLVSGVSDPKTRAGDQLVLFTMGHEGKNTLYDFWPDGPTQTQEIDGAVFIHTKSIFDFQVSCDLTKGDLVGFVDSTMTPFGEQEIGPARLNLEIDPAYMGKSVVDIMGTHHADKSASLDWRPVVQALGFVKNLHTNGANLTGELGFDAYNILYDLQGAFKDAGVPFTIWNTDGTFNADGMKTAMAALVEDFRNRHAHAFAKSEA